MSQEGYDNDKGYFFTSDCQIDEGAVIGKDTRIWYNSHIMSTARIGKGCIVGQGCCVAGKLGDGVKLQNHVSIHEGVNLFDDVFIGPNVAFTNVKRPRAFAKYPKSMYVKTLVDQGATIGANATILCDLVIGRYSFIGAGSVVTKDVKAFQLVLGNPAKHWGWICKCGNYLVTKYGGDPLARNPVEPCSTCGTEYDWNTTSMDLEFKGESDG